TVTVPGAAVRRSTSHGSESTLPPPVLLTALAVPAQPVPPNPGPRLQPHQLFSAEIAFAVRFCRPRVLPAMRLNVSVAVPPLSIFTPVPLLTMALLISCTGWL